MSTFIDGLLVVDKPQGLTSRAVVDRFQRIFPPGTRIGHAGTLDPLATGVLVIAAGKGTRVVEYVQAMEKEYRTRICLGGRSDTDDADGTITPVPGCLGPDQEAIRLALAQLVGEIEQLPPAYSAAHVSGQRAYRLARQGKAVNLQPRLVHVKQLDLIDYAFPFLDLQILCGKGTYVRSLARDLGEKLGCGGYVQTLQRIRTGPFTLADAVKLDEVPDWTNLRLQPLASALSELPSILLPQEDADRFRHGRAVTVDEPPKPGRDAAVFGPAGLVGVGSVDGTTLRPIKVLPSAAS